MCECPCAIRTATFQACCKYYFENTSNVPLLLQCSLISHVFHRFPSAGPTCSYFLFMFLAAAYLGAPGSLCSTLVDVLSFIFPMLRPICRSGMGCIAAPVNVCSGASIRWLHLPVPHCVGSPCFALVLSPKLPGILPLM